MNRETRIGVAYATGMVAIALLAWALLKAIGAENLLIYLIAGGVGGWLWNRYFPHIIKGFINGK